MSWSHGRVLERAADGVGIVTLVIGVACTLLPDRAGPALGLSGGRSATRVVGAIDLVLGAGLLRRGNPGGRWRWMAGRAAYNGLLAVSYARQGQRAGLRRMVVLGIFDGALAVALEGGTRRVARPDAADPGPLTTFEPSVPSASPERWISGR